MYNSTYCPWSPLWHTAANIWNSKFFRLFNCMYFLSLLAVHELRGQNLWSFPITIKNVEKNRKISKSENFETLYKNLEKYGSFSEFHTSTEKSVLNVGNPDPLLGTIPSQIAIYNRAKFNKA